MFSCGGGGGGDAEIGPRRGRAPPVAVVEARNVTPSMLLYYPARWFLNALRGIDSFVFALLFVAAVGLGPFAGVLGVALHTWGSTAKLWAEVIENIQPGPLEAAAVTGASRLKVLSFALGPTSRPAWVDRPFLGSSIPASTCSAWCAGGGRSSEPWTGISALLTILVLT